MAVHSPRLDRVGNPVRGVAALRELSERFGLHLMHNPAPGAATVLPDGADAAAGAAAESGGRALLAAQGALDFTAAERLLFALADRVPAAPGRLVLDLDRVTAVDATAEAMLTRALTLLAERGHRIVLVGDVLGSGPWERRPGGA